MRATRGVSSLLSRRRSWRWARARVIALPRRLRQRPSPERTLTLRHASSPTTRFLRHACFVRVMTCIILLLL
jgi:hypothetical protein